MVEYKASLKVFLSTLTKRIEKYTKLLYEQLKRLYYFEIMLEYHIKNLQKLYTKIRKIFVKEKESNLGKNNVSFIPGLIIHLILNNCCFQIGWFSKQ